MKKLFFLAVLLVTLPDVQSQNVGIGISTPAGKLDIANTSSVAEPTLSLFDYSANGGPRVHFGNAGGSSTWKVVTTINNATPFNSFLKIHYVGESFPILTVRGDGNVGINQASPAYRLDVAGDANFSGPLRMNSDAGTAGYVLTSNGVASPSWQPSPNPAIGFVAWLDGNVSLPASVTTNLVNYSQPVDDGNNFNPATGEFTAPSTGVYYFEAKINFILPSSGDTHLGVSFLKNGGTITGGKASLISPPNTIFPATVRNSMILKLNSGDVIKIALDHSAVVDLTATGNGTVGNSVFSGFKVY